MLKIITKERDTIKLCIDTKKFSSKPTDEKPFAKRLPQNMVDLPIDIISSRLVQPYGNTWTPAYFKPNANGKLGRTNECWAGQTLFALDFDKGITFEEVLNRCRKYSIEPAFAYSTFSSINNNKFRVVWQMPFEINDARVRKVIQFALMRIFPECDSKCKDASRMFYGGKELIHTKFDSHLSIVDLIREMCRYLKDTDSVNCARNIKSYCEAVGLDMVNGYPKVIPGCLNDSMIIEEMKSNPIINIFSIEHPTDSSNSGYIMCFSNRTKNVRGKTKYSVINEKVEHAALIDDFEFDELSKTCRLWDEFSKGDYWGFHHELYGICTNVITIKGGRKRFIEALDKGNEVSNNRYDVEKWEYYCNYNAKVGYKPQNCDKYCPYAGSCSHTNNMIEQVKLPRGRVRVLKEHDIKPLQQAEEELSMQFERVLKSKDNRVYVIKAPTGIGKTELYLNLKDVTIALPRHDLKEEVGLRMKAAGNSFITTPKLPDDEQLKYYYTVGNLSLANQYIKKKAHEGSKEYKDYLAQSQLAENAIGNVLTTHEKLLSLKNTNNTIIIDEDITLALFPVNATTLQEIDIMIKECAYFDTRKTLTAIKDFVQNAGEGIVYEMPSYGFKNTSKLEQLISENKINTNVLGFLNCSHFVKYTTDNGNVIINFINKRHLPEKKKMIMLSATANKYICKLVFGDALEFIDIGNVETKGKIEQYPEYSFSRNCMNDELRRTLAKSLSNRKKVISFKQFQKELNCSATFGATTGLDFLKGQDISVVGTPHINPVMYLLFANALGKKPRLNDCRTSMNYIKIRHNNFEFYFNTFGEDEILREIQMYLIESELIQAIGRARILRNDCTVTVLSNLPIVGAEFKYLTQEEKEKLIAPEEELQQVA